MPLPCRLGPVLAAAPPLLAAVPAALPSLPGAAALDDPAAPAALVACAAVAASSLPLHPLKAALASMIVPSKAIRSDPNPRLALVIKTPELCDPEPGPSGERSRQLKRGFRATEIPQ